MVLSVRITRHISTFSTHIVRNNLLRNASTRLLPCKRAIREYSKGRGFLSTRQDTRIFVSTLLPEERENLQDILHEFNQTEPNNNGAAQKTVARDPSMRQLRLVLLQSAIPFLGFGFLDNAIMIIAGEYIDFTIGITFGISTMAAAALGNIISDLAGIGLTGYVEAFASKLGIESPGLSSKQMHMKKTVLASNLGRAFGIVLGCVIGMFPLLFMESEADIIKEKLEKLESAEES